MPPGSAGTPRPCAAATSARSTPPSSPAAQDKSGVDESVITGEALLKGRRVAVMLGEFGVPGRVDRPGRRRPARDRDRAGDDRAPAVGLRAGERRHPDAGGHAGFRADGADLPGGRGTQGGRAPLPRLPAAPHDRRRDGQLGLARPGDGGRAGGAGRLPRPPRLLRALRQGVPRGRADLGEPRLARHHRRRRRHRRHRRGPAPRAQRPQRAPLRPARVTGPGRRADPRRRHLGRHHPVPAPGPPRRTPTAEVRRLGRRTAERHR